MSNLDNQANGTTESTAAAPEQTNTATTSETSTATSAPALQATLTINSATFVKAVGSLFFAGIGAGGVFAAFWAMTFVGAMFAKVMPFVFGGFLFAAIVSGFFLLLRAQKTMRRTTQFRVSASEAYTAISIFIAMGFFATACMHAFMGDNLALQHWNYGVVAIGSAATLFGMFRGMAAVWASGGSAK